MFWMGSPSMSRPSSNDRRFGIRNYEVLGASFLVHAKAQRGKGRREFKCSWCLMLGSSFQKTLAIFGWRLIRRDLLEVNGTETI